MSITVVLDCTTLNFGKFPIPTGAKMAGYVTGNGVAWTTAQFAKFPDALRIDQTPASTPWDDTADVDDYERGAVTLPELAPRAKARQLAFKAAKRAGQRRPIIYASQNSLTDVANALIAGGVTSGIGLWVANWNFTEPQAIADVIAASGPFPIVGVQFTDNAKSGGLFDTSVFSTAYLQDVSKVTTPNPNPAPTPPPVPSIPPFPIGFQPNWHWCRKCQSLFYFPNSAQSVCPSGGNHDGTSSHKYILPFM